MGQRNCYFMEDFISRMDMKQIAIARQTNSEQGTLSNSDVNERTLLRNRRIFLKFLVVVFLLNYEYRLKQKI